MSVDLRQCSWSKYTILNWDKTIIFNFSANAIDNSAVSAGSKRWVTIGELRDAAVGDPTDKAVGIRADALAIKGIVHDGTDLSVVDLGVNYHNFLNRNIMIVSSAGNVDWYVDGVLEGSSADGPTGDSTSHYDSIRIMMDNNGSADLDLYLLHSMKIYVEQ